MEIPQELAELSQRLEQWRSQQSGRQCRWRRKTGPLWRVIGDHPNGYGVAGSIRVVNIQHPGGTGTTYYAYQGDKITVTDPAGKWKRYTTDAFGNLMQVAEPRPGGGEYTTSYTYNGRGQLLTVSMPRDGTTQTRTFTYDGAGKMLTETHPETGTTTFTYNADNTLNNKVDAKGQTIEFVYDSMKRVTQVKKYPSTIPGPAGEVVRARQLPLRRLSGDDTEQRWPAGGGDVREHGFGLRDAWGV
jgi:YD repeat-containing protein